jgi:hypothetical protein
MEIFIWTHDWYSSLKKLIWILKWIFENLKLSMEQKWTCKCYVKFYLNLKVDSSFLKFIILNINISSLDFIFDFQNLKIWTGKFKFEFWKKKWI